MLVNNGRNLLHHALADQSSNFADVTEKVEYLCDQCPILMHMKDNFGITPLLDALMCQGRLNIQAIGILCHKDKSVLRDMCTPSNIKDSKYKQLPLHFLIRCKPPKSEVSVEGIYSCIYVSIYIYV
jgi:hypothetical protein